MSMDTSIMMLTMRCEDDTLECGDVGQSWDTAGDTAAHYLGFSEDGRASKGGFRTFISAFKIFASRSIWLPTHSCNYNV